MGGTVYVIVGSLIILCCQETTASHNKWWRCTRECIRCVRGAMTREDFITEFYSGLFHRLPPEDNFNTNHMFSGANTFKPPGINAFTENRRNPENLGTGVWNGSSGSTGKPKIELPRSPGDLGSHVWIGDLGVFQTTETRNPNVNSDSALNTDTSTGTQAQSWSFCCETVKSHMVLNSTEYQGQTYTVVQVKEKYQFIPVGRCREGTSCVPGTCVQKYRPHWILVYNNTKPLTTVPVIFIPKPVPSHCECVNVGLPGR